MLLFGSIKVMFWDLFGLYLLSKPLLCFMWNFVKRKNLQEVRGDVSFMIAELIIK